MTLICARCGLSRAHEARGLCHNCYVKARALGMLDAFPKRGRPKAKPRAAYWRQRDAGRRGYFEALYALRRAALL